MNIRANQCTLNANCTEKSKFGKLLGYELLRTKLCGVTSKLGLLNTFPIFCPSLIRSNFPATRFTKEKIACFLLNIETKRPPLICCPRYAKGLGSKAFRRTAEKMKATKVPPSVRKAGAVGGAIGKGIGKSNPIMMILDFTAEQYNQMNGGSCGYTL